MQKQKQRLLSYLVGGFPATKPSRSTATLITNCGFGSTNSTLWLPTASDHITTSLFVELSRLGTQKYHTSIKSIPVRQCMIVASYSTDRGCVHSVGMNVLICIFHVSQLKTWKNRFILIHNSCCAQKGNLTFVITVSSMMPPLSLVKTLRVLLPAASPSMSPTTNFSRKGTASLPLSRAQSISIESASIERQHTTGA